MPSLERQVVEPEDGLEQGVDGIFAGVQRVLRESGRIRKQGGLVYLEFRLGLWNEGLLGGDLSLEV